jgi:hypothetical protein
VFWPIHCSVVLSRVQPDQLLSPFRHENRELDKRAGFDLQSEDYVLGKHTYKSQYAQMYYARLMELAPLVKQRAQQQWERVPGVNLVRLCCLPVELILGPVQHRFSSSYCKYSVVHSCESAGFGAWG